MSAWRPRVTDGARMKYLGIVEALEADMRSGRVRPGDRLPAQRAVAAALNVDLTTVTRAFNEARRRGLVDAQPGRGTFIREESEREFGAGLAMNPPALDLSMNIAPQPASAALQERIPREIAALLSNPRGMLHLHYQESTGSDADRRAGAAWLESRIKDVQPGKVLVANGAQSALFGLCRVLFRPGDVVATGAMTYPGFKAAALQEGVVLSPLAMDEGGIIPDAFERACRDRVPKGLYVIPSVDNPTAATLTEERRRQLANIARKHNIIIIEDDPYAPLRNTVTPAFATLAPDLTWHIATLSKCATPALRIAYVVAPSQAQMLHLAGVLRATILMASPLMAALASRWILDGELDEITRAIREENMARQQLAASILKAASFAADPCGHHLWLRLPPSVSASDFAEQANRSGIAVVPSAAFAVGPSSTEAVRVSLGAAVNRAALEDALSLLVSMCSHPFLAARAVV